MAHRTTSRLLLLLGAVLVLLWWVRPPSDPAGEWQAGLCHEPGERCQRIEQAELPDHGHAPVSLPHARSADQDGPMRYRMVLQVTEGMSGPRRDVGLCLPRSALIERVEVDGRAVPLPAPPSPRGFLRPLHVRLLHAASPGAYELLLQVNAPPGLAPGLGTFWAGDDDAMAAACAELAGTVRDRTYGLTWVMAAMGMASLLLWARLRDGPALWFGLTTMAWVGHLWIVSAAPRTLDPELWSRLFFSTRVLFLGPALLYVLALTGASASRRTAAVLLGAFGLTCGLLWWLPEQHYTRWLVGVALLALPLSLAVWGRLAWRLLHQVTLQRSLMTAAFGAVVAAHAVDLARWWGAAGYDTRAWSYLAVPFLCVVFGARLMQDLIAHARRDARDAQRLRREVDAQRVRIAADYERLQQQREQLAVLQERRRIVRDMHDGLGAQLLSASARLKSPQSLPPERIAALFDEALLELRGVLDVLSVEPSQDPDDDPVSSLLGTLRWRMAPALAARGIALEWHCEALPAHFLPSDAARMHLLRLWQEAFSNVLKHSQATRVRFDAGPSGPGIAMTLRDDGRGFDPGQGAGIGLGSMRARATAVGAVLEIRSGKGKGTEVGVTWG